MLTRRRKTRVRGRNALLYDEFKADVRQILDPEGDASGGLVPIPVVRRALAARITAEEFDVFLCALQRDGFVHLLTHVDADQLGDDDRKACLNRPSGVVAYWVCWVSGAPSTGARCYI